MKKIATTRGRPKTSPLTRAEQLRAAKRMQRQRERQAGLATVELRLPVKQAQRLRVAANNPRFRQVLDDFLQNMVLDINKWPTLSELTWNRSNPWIPAEEALALYERNWRFVELQQLTSAEANLIDHLKNKFGNGVLNV